MFKLFAKKIIVTTFLLGLALPVLAADVPADGNSSTSTNSQGAVKATAFDRLKSVTDKNWNENTNEDTAVEYAGYLITVFLSLLGIIFLALALYAGYNWMTAQGDKAKVDKAQKILTAAIIGLIIIVAVYALWRFLFARVVSISPDL
ncbi:MAG: hypothetical protein PHR00_00485 [Patescibacteria group bacterium]|nr:hypothetical protein [Patescibacteria group bacterium]